MKSTFYNFIKVIENNFNVVTHETSFLLFIVKVLLFKKSRTLKSTSNLTLWTLKRDDKKITTSQVKELNFQS